MTAVCTPYHAIGMTMTDSSNGAKVQEPAREVGDGSLVATATDPDGGVLRLTQDHEVIRNG
jgi:predicted enzyme related to lactoylglutathione lyase